MAIKHIMIPCDQEYKDEVKEEAKKHRMSSAAYIRVAIAEKKKNDRKELNCDN